MNISNLKIGTCSWKYDSWRGIIYPEFGEINYLNEYSKKFSTVEIDQWFWSLHTNNKILLPKPNVVNDYAKQTPKDFKFTIKVPNSVTLTHPYKSTIPNAHFLSNDLMDAFLKSLEPLKSKIGCLILQFEYLNKLKMSSQEVFQYKLEEFFSKLDRDYNYAIEIRNPNYINNKFFTFLNNQDISFVFLHGYYMPPIFKTFEQYGEFVNNISVIRLHGFDRKGIEKKTNKIWNKRVIPQDDDINKIVKMIKILLKNKNDLYLNVNNHFEGSAPLTIERIKTIL